MQAAELTPEVASNIERLIVRSVFGTIVSKKDLPLYGAVRAIFDDVAKLGVNVPTGEQLDRTAHAIGPLYIKPLDALDPLNTVLLAVHEATHISQFYQGEFVNDMPHDKRDLGGGFEFAWLYIVNPTARLRFEQRAERARWEVLHALGKPLPTAKQHVDTIFSFYAMPNDDAGLRAFATGIAESNIAGARFGHPQSPVAIKAISLLRDAGVIV